MSRQQWGHGYWAGRESARLKWPPRFYGQMNVWHPRNRRYWRRHIRHPFMVDASSHDGTVVITILGFSLFFGFGEALR